MLDPSSRSLSRRLRSYAGVALVALVIPLAGCESPEGPDGLEGMGDAGADAPTSGEADATPVGGDAGEPVDTSLPIPESRCDSAAVRGDASCGAQPWTLVSGTVSGLEGTGLQLAVNDELLPISADGAFTFRRASTAGTPYEVSVAAQPTAPNQTCTLEHAQDIADAAQPARVVVHCITNTYAVRARVGGLQGTGLALQTSLGVVTVQAPGTYSIAQYRDGARYQVQLAAQPTSPDQICYLTGGEGVIQGEDVTVDVLCGSAGTLRVTELGSCPYSNSACWFEITNVGQGPEQLASYTLRTSALSTSEYLASHVFVLPQVQIPPAGVIVVQARTLNTLPDGQGVYHIADGDVLPWWSDDGFVELLDAAGATASFVRFGSNDTAPTTEGTWEGDAAPALPRGSNGYGFSLQRLRGATALLTRASEFARHAFATYGGPNDVSGEVDADDDGIPDAAELPGATFAGMDLYGMGARAGQRDLFVEIDRMRGSDPALSPQRTAVDMVVQAFARRGIALHPDAGSLFSSSFDPANYNLGGGNEVAFAAAVGIRPSEGSIADLYDYKAANMEARRRGVFYYMLFGSSQNENGRAGPSGIGELVGNDSLITLGGATWILASQAQRNLLTNYQAATMMHELGHNLGLRHGGADLLNRKPNYLSVMNYLYSPLGLSTIGNAEGDRYALYSECLFSLVQLTNSPIGDPQRFVIDFSNGTGADLDESALLEAEGLGRSGSGVVDYNCNGKVDPPYARDLNADGSYDVLMDHDDWSALQFVFRRFVSGAESGPSVLWKESVSREDQLTSDRARTNEEPCPALLEGR